MRSFRDSLLAGRLSILCIVALALPILVGALAPTPAMAQTEMTKIAVVDFRNLSSNSDETYATMAHDGTMVDLMTSGKFDVTKPEDVQSSMQQVGYVASGKGETIILTPTMMQRLGQTLEVDSVISGDLTSIKIDKKKKVATVGLVVKMLDVASGECINGAAVTGTSHPRIGYAGDKDAELVGEAISDACRNAVDTMVQYIIPKATVLGSPDSGTVLLNKGSQDGLVSGLRMVVTRVGNGGKDEMVAKIRVTTVGDTDAHGTIIEQTRGVKPEDHAVAIYDIPNRAGDGVAEGPRDDRAQRRSAKAHTMLYGALLMLGAWSLFGNGGSTKEELPDCAAMAGVSPDITARWPLAGDGGVLIVWNDIVGLGFSNTLEFHIWRDHYGKIIPGGDAKNTGLVDAVGRSAALPWDIDGIGDFDHSIVQDAVGWETLGYSFPSEDNTALETASAKDITGIETGFMHKYYVSCLYSRIDASTGEPSSYWETDPVFAGQATWLDRPIAGAPGSNVATDYVDLSDVTFEWQGSMGADEYVIEVSADPNFPRDNRTWVSPKIFQPTAITGMPYAKQFTGDTALSASTELSGVATGTVLYWRVGARSRYDSPGCYPAGPSRKASGAKNTRYIYSDPNALEMFYALNDNVPAAATASRTSSGSSSTPGRTHGEHSSRSHSTGHHSDTISTPSTGTRGTHHRR